MFCMNCGKDIGDAPKFCKYCGWAVASPEQLHSQKAQPELLQSQESKHALTQKQELSYGPLSAAEPQHTAAPGQFTPVPLASRARCAGAALFARRLATSGLNNSFFIGVPGP
ncbi:MAG: zinc ribbon domain-containing protein [Oscillospiraceae bacterium]|nr:zinc ribbon domain-containing protein [Oscillospiraceae bacterium]